MSRAGDLGPLTGWSGDMGGKPTGGGVSLFEVRLTDVVTAASIVLKCADSQVDALSGRGYKKVGVILGV